MIISQCHIPKNTFKLICNICEQDDLVFTNNLILYFQNLGSKKLLDLNIAARADNNIKYFDYSNKSYEIIYKDDSFGYYKNELWHQLDQNEIIKYRLDITKFIKIISKELEITQNIEAIFSDYFFLIGEFKFKKKKLPIFFARKINFQKVYQNIYQQLKKRNGIESGIILTSSKVLAFNTDNILDHKILSLHDCLLYNSKNFHIDRNILQQVANIRINQEGFSNNYKVANIDGVDYKFSTKQSQIVEILAKHGGKINKYDLLLEIGSEQNDLFRIFRNSQGKYHKAWNKIIKNDGRGNYWLEY